METLNTHVSLHSLNLSNVCHKRDNHTKISKNIYYLLRSVWQAVVRVAPAEGALVVGLAGDARDLHGRQAAPPGPVQGAGVRGV